tara:strand:+ start:19761 stop:22808 length:3048 start_codon:yes stop_codon:yes gene_type:complete
MEELKVTLCDESIHVLSLLCSFMESKALSAVFLTLIMLLSGCFGSGSDESPADSVTEPEAISVDVYTLQTVNNEYSVGEIVLVEGTVEIYPIDTSRSYEYEIKLPSGIADIENTFTDSGESFKLIFAPDEPGYWLVTIRLVVEGMDDSIEEEISFYVNPPDEGDTILSTDSVIEMDNSAPLTITGKVIHSDTSTCTVTDGISSQTPDSNGDFSLSQGVVEESYNVTITAVCGIWTSTEDARNIRVMLLSGDDMDGDGIPDDSDSCPNGYGESDGWVPNENTDRDEDGCHDFEEDRDDDNDLIPDVDDDCASQIGWTSTTENDYDQDGCDDAVEDSDDDNDGIDDEFDYCPKGDIGWESKPYTDWDGDGCQDFTEDLDDDNDLVNDTVDDCWRGLSNWYSTTEFDYDGDGCNDEFEDLDDDSDGVNDVNSTGVTLDECPRSPLDAQDIDERGCDATERDTDSDGIMDSDDSCPGTPIGNSVNEVGCADLDGDGVFSNVDNCSDTKEKWTPDNAGCAVYQLPVSWKETGHGNGRMDTVAHFSLPTLDGTWSFRNEWNGNDVYIFLFKYTDSSGSGNNGDWSSNPGSMIRQLPDNAHLFYGSFDNSYHNDVLGRQTAVQNALNPEEELKWEDRIHYIDQDMSASSGGMGDLINNWNTLYYGIDRFQRAREIGSIYAWTSQSNDITHWAYEARMYNYEFPTEVRETDPNVHTVTIVDEAWHSGGWNSGYGTKYENVSISLPNNISTYDTLEVFHEHGCEERRDRYADGGCHEWDYLAYMKICERNDSASCGTEFMRWITTYGREGRWLTDISPYLFMLEDNDVRTFKYEGANKGMMTIKLLFSDWNVGERSSSGEQVFTGGQFNGQYNNESTYKRQHNFSTLTDYDSVKIVATITGHGFNQDQANCAEFCDHEHHYYLNGFHAYEWHPIVGDNQGCEKKVDDGVVANQYGSWPFGRAGWCAGQDVKQWTYDITDWVDNSSTNNLEYRGLFNGQEYVPQDTNGGGREIRANIWLVWYNQN